MPKRYSSVDLIRMILANGWFKPGRSKGLMSVLMRDLQQRLTGLHPIARRLLKRQPVIILKTEECNHFTKSLAGTIIPVRST